ncbi:MAG: cyclic GMP-AMP synthase DncV-like nucleotidyltransferase [Pyrinomonadaceae bacterium]
MYDTSKQVLSYHNDKVTLAQKERDEMRDRRDSNRTRAKLGLDENRSPKPREFATQGSYAMRTMTQHSDKDYDIDDGVYFNKEDLIKEDGTEKSALEARQMVRDAVDDGSFKTSPKMRNNCVRIYYDAGYHVDIPVYRRVISKDLLGNEEIHYELASTDWKRSDARDVTAWFNEENKRQSPDAINGRQLRRITREIKKFARSRSTWEGKIASGFMITKLVTECYIPYGDREDKALYYTMQSIRDRLELSLEVKHPVTPDDLISKGSDDPKPRFLKEKLSDALSWVSVLFEADCTQKQALAAWDKVFNTDYFSDKLEEETAKSYATVVPAFVSSNASRVVRPRPPFGDD